MASLKEESLAFARSLLLMPDFKMWWPPELEQQIADKYEASVEQLELFYEGCCIKQDHEISQTLAKAIGGYPWYKDDPKNFPGAAEADGVCTGEETAESLALQAATIIKRLRRRLADAGIDEEEQADGWSPMP